MQTSNNQISNDEIDLKDLFHRGPANACPER